MKDVACRDDVGVVLGTEMSHSHSDWVQFDVGTPSTSMRLR